MSDGALHLVGALLSLAGSLLFLCAAIGLLRLPDFYTRAHAPTKAATLGLLFAALASMFTHGERDAAFWLTKLLIIFFVLLTACVLLPLATRISELFFSTSIPSAIPTPNSS